MNKKGRSYRTQSARIAAALIAMLAVGAPPALAAKGSPLPKVKLAKLPSSLAPGQRLSIAGKARAGSRKTGAATATFVLSRDAKLSGKDLRLGGLKIKAIKAQKTRKLKVKLTVPASAATGSYHFLACLKLKGKKHRNKCKSVKSVTVQGGNGVFPDSIPKNLRGITPHPRSVTPHLDNAHAVTGDVTPGSGGTLSTTGADGTKYTLKVPAGAVLSTLTATMTPLSSVGGLGMSGGFVGGVQMTPDGIQLLNPARLTIVPTGGAPTSGRTAFAYEGSGQNFGLLPRDPGSSLSFELTHFSGGGVGSATSGDLASQANHAPAGTPEQFQQELEHLSGDASARLDSFHQYYNDVLKPQLEAALVDESLAPAAIVDALAATRQMAILGFDVSATEFEIHQFELKILKNAYNRAYDRCVNQHSPAEAVNMLAYLRQLEILGAGGDVDSTKTWKCVRFKLDYQVDFRHAAGTLNDESMGVQSLGAPLEYDSSLQAVDGDLPLTVTHYSFKYYNCGNITGGTTTVTEQGFAKLDISPNPKKVKKGRYTVVTYGPPAITVFVVHGTVSVTHNCANPPDHDTTFYDQMWHYVFPDLFATGPQGTIALRESHWSYLGGAVYAKTNLAPRHLVNGGDIKDGNLRLTLYHTPG